MLSHFPEPYPDELLYSLCARARQRLPATSNKVYVEKLFSSRQAQAVIDLPCRISALLTSLPRFHCYTADELIDQHTLFPIFERFLPENRAQAVRECMKNDSGSSVHMRCGIAASRVCTPRSLRSCLECDRADILQFGETYWHRIHQVPGVEICPIHQVCLTETEVRRRCRGNRNEFCPATSAAKPEAVPFHKHSTSVGETLLSISNGVAWLLQNPGYPMGGSALHDRYLELLNAHGFATPAQSIRLSLLLHTFRARYSVDLLRLLQCEVTDDGGWIARLLRNSSTLQQPVRYLLLMDFLGVTPESFFQNDVPAESFETGPYPCLNPTCFEFHQPTIHAFEPFYHRERKRFGGTFQCDVCGYAYCRLGPDPNAAGRFRAQWVKDYGWRWQTCLRQFWENPHLSLRELARKLGVDPLTAKRHARKIGLVFPRYAVRITNALPATCSRPNFRRDTRDRRGEWIELVACNKSAGVKELRTRSPALYAWLYRNDRQWLIAHSPRRVRGTFGIKADWESRDRIICEALPGVLRKIKSRDGKPIRVTCAAISREIVTIAHLDRHLDRLPRTSAAIAEAVESREEFASRRVKWAARMCRQEQKTPHRWVLVRRAGLRPDMAASRLVKQALEDAQREFESRRMSGVSKKVA